MPHPFFFLRTVISKVLVKLQIQLANSRTYGRIHKFQGGQIQCGSKAQQLLDAIAGYRERLPDKEESALQAIEQLRQQMLHDNHYLAKNETISQVCRIGSKRPDSCRLLYALIRRLKPDHCLELGTCLGISAAYQAEALRQNGAGLLLSLEGQINRAAVAEKNLGKLDLQKEAVVIEGWFENTLSAQLRQLGQVNYAFVDGHHEKEATLNYFRQILPYMPQGGVLVFDDIYWSAGMRQAWRIIRRHAQAEIAFAFNGMGFVVLRAL